MVDLVVNARPRRQATHDETAASSLITPSRERAMRTILTARRSLSMVPEAARGPNAGFTQLFLYAHNPSGDMGAGGLVRAPRIARCTRESGGSIRCRMRRQPRSSGLLMANPRYTCGSPWRCCLRTWCVERDYGDRGVPAAATNAPPPRIRRPSRPRRRHLAIARLRRLRRRRQAGPKRHPVQATTSTAPRVAWYRVFDSNQPAGGDLVREDLLATARQAAGQPAVRAWHEGTSFNVDRRGCVRSRCQRAEHLRPSPSGRGVQAAPGASELRAPDLDDGVGVT